MKKHLLRYVAFFVLGLYSSQSIACDCYCEGDCSFSTVSTGGFVALVKVIEYSEFLEFEDDGKLKKMPLAMKVEIIRKYKGEDTRKIIQIWGDDGMLCRPYTDNFKIGNHYLIAPNKIMKDSENGKRNDYDFFACETGFLDVDLEKKMVYGAYSKNINKISLDKVEIALSK
ncbi:hypothetical protein ATE84_1153 [Aquimarina sp. MAR_2010_214]|uniref:hypothetical protein n=1 Tax=Aquimarina sp. MAR_2010_214 TaxID=1250026 RepID=UPI000C7018BE|nr:hypothetical protein [Aquimarina sp. MAR_2010_214]PKV49136.1 hypothetical protein ATE84_1153 [Aquimarina sp. MAR_2010_214]